MKNLYIYILHCKSLTERDTSINNIVSKLKDASYKNLNIKEVSVIASNDPSEVPIDVIQKTIDYSMIQDASLSRFNQFIKNIHINQLSNTLKHFDALSNIVKKPDSDEDLYLVLEDDMLFGEELNRSLDTIIGSMKEESLVFLGLPSSDQGELCIKPTSANFSVIPLVDSYLITHKTAKLIVDNFFPIKFTSVFQMNYLLSKLGIVSYQSTKNIFVNGSKYGMFVSTLSPNNSLVFNKDYMSILEIVNKQGAPTEDNDIYIEKLLKESPINKSPDFLHLVAKYKMKKNNFKDAEKLFAEAYNLSLSNHGIINHESTMLKDFISIFKYLQ